jgi:glycerol-3-phosphate dehydrogenase (NAD(P)+)
MSSMALLGGGAWGTALAAALTRAGQRALLWVRDPGQAEAIARLRRNERYLPEIALPGELAVTASLRGAVEGADLLLAATPVAGLRDVLTTLRAENLLAPLVWLCKGFEQGTGRLPHQIVAETVGDAVPSGALSGPSFALEVARGLPCALTLASESSAFAREAAAILHGGRLRVYHTNDVIGVEIGGAVKNVMAIAVGICDGLGLGQNARAALITRGLAEISRLGVALGGAAETFMGLAGAGDLILTATGDLSRNRRVGLGLARGQSLAEILGALGHVAEGVRSAQEVSRLADSVNVEMPITDAVNAVLGGRLAPLAAAEVLLARDPKPESVRRPR